MQMRPHPGPRPEPRPRVPSPADEPQRGSEPRPGVQPSARDGSGPEEAGSGPQGAGPGGDAGWDPGPERGAPEAHRPRPSDGAPASPPPRRPAPWRAQVPVVGVVALGGALGATARYGVQSAWPTAAGGIPWATLTVNAVGCAVIGVFMVVVGSLRTVHPLLRPFFGTGVLGGFTTFSTYAGDTDTLLAAGHTREALVYLTVTLAAALAAVWSAAWLTRRVMAWRRR